MSEAEDKKLEAAERDDAAHKDNNEEIPAWADALMKSHKAVMDRLDAMEARKDATAEAADADCKADAEKDGGEDPTEDTDGKKKDALKDARKDAECEDKEEAKADAADKDKEREDAARKDREDRARKDSAAAAETRKLQAKIAELEHQMRNVYAEPTIDDRNAIADARSRADSVFQAALGRTAPDAIPGEKPIAYRKRLADALKKFSPTFKKERLDSLSGSVYETVESRIYADALEAVKTPAVIAPGQLRAIKRRELGHDITEYVGDPLAAWGPFAWGSGGKVSFNQSAGKRG